MLKNTTINREATKKIAMALGDLNKDVVFVGGAVVSLYIDDPAADDVRPTKDIDISFEIASFSELEELRTTLIKKGFYQTSEDDVVCRFRYDDIKVDVMATEPVGWAPGSPWFAEGTKHTQIVNLDNIEIRLLPIGYFLATKFSAFYDRGGKDPRTSHDFEDIVYILNYTLNLKELIIDASNNLKQYLKEAFQKTLDSKTLQEAIIGNLYHEDQIARFDKIMNLLIDINKNI